MIPASRADAYRLALVRHAYRMLGERAEAEDAVQDAYVRRHQAATRAPIADDLAFLRVTVTRLCLNRLRSARARREAYVGPWLPEPLIGRGDDDPAAHAAFADDVSFALLLALERLSALERAAFLLHDVMGVPFAEVAQTLGRTEDAVKRLASRARVHVRRPERRGLSPADAFAVRDAFADAIARGDVDALQGLLASDIVFVSDSGGKVPSALVPVRGVDRVGRLIWGLVRKAPVTLQVERVIINGSPGFTMTDGDAVVQTLALDIRDGAITAIYVTRNPVKLAAVRGHAPA